LRVQHQKQQQHLDIPLQVASRAQWGEPLEPPGWCKVVLGGMGWFRVVRGGPLWRHWNFGLRATRTV